MTSPVCGVHISPHRTSTTAHCTTLPECLAREQLSRRHRHRPEERLMAQTDRCRRAIEQARAAPRQLHRDVHRSGDRGIDRDGEVRTGRRRGRGRVVENGHRQPVTAAPLGQTAPRRLPTASAFEVLQENRPASPSPPAPGSSCAPNARPSGWDHAGRRPRTVRFAVTCRPAPVERPVLFNQPQAAPAPFRVPGRLLAMEVPR